MAQPTKKELKDKGLTRIQIIIPTEMEKLIKILADKLKSGEIAKGDTIKLE